MSKSVADQKITSSRSQLQSYILIITGALFLLLAWFLNLNPFQYPLGILLFGVFMLVAAAFNPYRLLIGGIFATLIGVWIYLAFKPVSFIPNGGDSLTVMLAIGIGMLLIALLQRRGYVGKGAITPALIVLLAGFIEYPPTAHLLKFDYAHFLLSLWFPGIGLLVVGLAYLLWSLRR